MVHPFGEPEFYHMADGTEGGGKPWGCLEGEDRESCQSGFGIKLPRVRGGR